jgi:hypothetical protein
MNVIIKKSSNPKKKYDAIFEDKKISFGSKGYLDFTLTGNNEQKKRYIDRHKKNENWNKVESAGFLSRYILWNKPTLKESIKDINEKNKKYNFKLS